MAEENNITLYDTITGCDHYHLEIDPLRFKQVIINLLSNAVKFNRINGEVHIGCHVNQDNELHIHIRDTGPGLTPEEQRTIFEPFNRLNADERAIGGTGIGLTITRNLVELMGGQIGVSSIPGQGSKFWVEFPIRMISSDVVSLPDPAQQQNDKDYTVLYVEDDADNLRLVSDIILTQRRDIRLLDAPSAEIGLNIARRQLPDVILMDLNLPGMSGQTALATLQNDIRTSSIPVIAISADALPETIVDGLRAGFLEYLTKPIHVTDFLNTLDNALEYARSEKQKRH
jgi:CheY-like chemotaxis protein